MACMFARIFDFNKNSGCVSDSLKHIWNNYRTAVIAVGVVAAGAHIYAALQKRKKRNEWNSVGKDVVVLHSFSRGRTIPNNSPFVLKIETYMRMSGIKYVIDVSSPFGAKEKCPWITLNGEDFTDTHLIMLHLGAKYGMDFSSHLSQEQKGAATAFATLADEYIFWALPWFYFLNDKNDSLRKMVSALPLAVGLLKPMYKRRYQRLMWGQGIGRHRDEDIVMMIRESIEAISRFLGQKQFLMGNEPCEADCSIFGVLAQFVWATPGSPFRYMVETDFRNIIGYCNRMKDRYWSDWEDILAK